MEIEGYVLGSPPHVGNVLGCPSPLLGEGSLPARSPHSQCTEQRLVVTEIKGYVLGCPPPVAASFGVPTTSVVPLCWAKGPFACFQLAPLTPNGLSRGRA